VEIFKNKSIILFDGVCNLCNASVNFIIKHDKNERFIFASLQSDAAKEILLQFPEKKINLDSIILIENDSFYEKSTAVLLITKHLNYGLKNFYYLKYLPLFFRDAIYSFIAKNRYHFFGKRKFCSLPKNKVKHRFL